jgi:hypothetical protein
MSQQGGFAMSRRHAAVWAGWVMGAMLVGCGSDSTTHVAAPENAMKSACLSDAKTIGVLGGRLQAGPYSLVVPPGALLQSTMLTMEQEQCGAWPVRLGPEGTQFLVPVFLEFDASGELNPYQLDVAWWNPTTNQWVDQFTYHKGTQVGAPISHFSRYIMH